MLAEPSTCRLEQGADRIALTWPNGRRDEFHYLWLRDNCLCPQCREPAAWERLFDTVGMPPDLAPARTEMHAGVLEINWPDRHTSTFSQDWLRSHAYPRAATTQSTEVCWDARIAGAAPQISLAEIDSDPGGLRGWLELLDGYGFCLVRDVPTEVDTVLALAERIAPVQPSNFGRSFQVRSKPNPENLAYTAHRLYSHTDIVNRHSSRNLQFLHCLQFDATGGESILVDGFAAARRLAGADPGAHDLLTRVSVPWRYQDDAVDIGNRFPVITLDEHGDYNQVRFHTGLLAPLDLDPELTAAFYQAFIRFGQLLREPQAQYQFRMQPGDCQVFDNRRVLHARAAFDPQSGPRHLQGCYIDTDDFDGRLRAARRDRPDFREC